VFIGPRSSDVRASTRCTDDATNELCDEQNLGVCSRIPANENSTNSVCAISPKADIYERHCETAISDSTRKPEDPFDFDVYVGFSPENKAAIQPAIHALTTELDLLCCVRDRQIADVSTKKEDIIQSITCSEKCLLFVTPEYTSDPLFEAETNAAVEKANRFSRDMLFVLKDSRVPAEILNARGLHGFRAATVWSTTIGDDTLRNELIPWLLEEVHLTPVTQLPREISGSCEAYFYFYGFLNLVLQNHRQNMKTAAESWPEVAGSGAQFVLPMLIVVPESCRAPASFDVADRIVTSSKYIVSASHHGGSKNRDYKRSVIKLVVNPENDDVIYFSGDFPACLLTLYETVVSGQTGLTEVQLGEIATDFLNTLQSLLCHPDNRHCIDQYRLVLWPDTRVSLFDCLLPVVRGAAAEEGDASSLVVDGTRGAGSRLMEASFTRLESRSNLRNLCGGSEPYAMRDGVSPRGICLILDIVNASTTAGVLQELHKLFSEQLDFDVRSHRGQMTWDQLDLLLCETAQECHGGDAFVCYVASRGRAGHVCTSDGTCSSVVTLVNNFVVNSGQNLHGKPKLFLLQTTDDGMTTECSQVSRDNDTRVNIII